jgi:hypothetical protein
VVLLVEGLEHIGALDPPELLLESSELDEPTSLWSRSLALRASSLRAECLRREKALERLLISQAGLLQLPCQLVVMVPGWLGEKHSLLQQAWSGGVVGLSHLDSNVPCFLTSVGALLRARLEGAQLADRLVQEIATSAGGVLKDLLGLCQLVLRGFSLQDALKRLKIRYQRLWPLLHDPEAKELTQKELWRGADRGFYEWAGAGLLSRRLWEQG